METKIFKGDKVKDPILFTVKNEISAWKLEYGLDPGIAFVGFTNVPLGKYNIPFHVKSAEALGFKVFNEIQTENTNEKELWDVIESLNQNRNVHTIELLQPLPAWINPLQAMSRIRSDKEAEGFHPENMMYNLFPGYRNRDFTMCLPAALQKIFDFYNYKIIRGAEWVLAMDQEFIDNPLVNMVARTALMKCVPVQSAVSVVNSDSPRLHEYVGRADYLVVVSKKPGLIRPEWLKPGTGIIDIYSNLTAEVPSKNDPGILVPVIKGGVDAESVSGIASFIVPVPGGLMPVVLALMFRNALKQFVEQLKSTKLILHV